MSLVLNYISIAKNAIFKVPYAHFVYSFVRVLGTRFRSIAKNKIGKKDSHKDNIDYIIYEVWKSFSMIPGNWKFNATHLLNIIIHCHIWKNFHIVSIYFMAMKNNFMWKDQNCKKLITSCLDLHRLEHFFYYPNDYLFESFAILIHFRYTSTKIRHGIVNHFWHCLSNGHDYALHSFNTELTLGYLQYLHHDNDIEMYLEGLSKLSSIFAPSTISLLEDVLHIKWFSKSLSVPVNVWIFTNDQAYLRLNSNINGYQYNILFHNQNPTCGNFEPLFLHNTVDSVA